MATCIPHIFSFSLQSLPKALCSHSHPWILPIHTTRLPEAQISLTP